MKYDRTEIDSKIRETFTETFMMQNDGETVPALAEDTVLLDTGMDSLGFAILVTRLEEELGFDPFSSASEAFYPRTLGEFVDFYVAHAPQ